LPAKLPARCVRQTRGAVCQAKPGSQLRGVSANAEVTASRASSAPTGNEDTCWSEACPRSCQRGESGKPEARSVRRNRDRSFAECQAKPTSQLRGVSANAEVTASRASSAPTGIEDTCWSEACPRSCQRGVSGKTDVTASRASSAPTGHEDTCWSEACPRSCQRGESGKPEARSVRRNRDRSFASKLGSNKERGPLLERGLPAKLPAR
jgi:hypothetical protein